jgi:aminopeptidase N
MIVFKQKRPKMILPTLLLIALWGGVFGISNYLHAVNQTYGKKVAISPEDQLLNSAFRIDISTIQVTFDYTPDLNQVRGEAEVTFKMRPGQSRPLIHFDLPALHAGDPLDVKLNGESLQPGNAADMVILSSPESTQKAIEFQRDLEANVVHRLEIKYVKELPQDYPIFATQVTDLYGWGNEELFPTINTPHELARHILTIRVHSSTAYRCIGSGRVTESSKGSVQQWVLDSEREIASYTFLFVVIPAADTVYEEKEINGVTVRIVAYRGGASLAQGFNQMESWLPELHQNLGPFPMPRGLSIFLVSGGGGMEYYGGTITSLWALNHEVFHMYYGCSTVMKTYRDSWLDEAINEWYEYSVDPTFQPIDENYRSNMVSGRSPIAVAFDRRAYYEGAQMMQYVAQKIGGRLAMIGFLKYVHATYNFSPFSTVDFVNYLKDFTGVDFMNQFINWVFDGQAGSGGGNRASSRRLKKVDLLPPADILKRYVKGEEER